MSAMPINATFYAFKPSGKWKYTGRGYLNAAVFDLNVCPDKDAMIAQILSDNFGYWPGTATAAEGLTLVVIPDDDCPYGLPQMYVRPPWKD